MSGKGVGMRVGGKGSWRRKAKKAPTGSQEADKLWLAAQRQGCRDIGGIDGASIIMATKETGLSFTKPELAIDMRANTYVLRGKPEEKPIAELLTELIQGMASNLAKANKDEKKDELGNVENVDFSKPEEEKQEEKKEE
ncbi:NAC domain containing protein [Trichomonas vaginalis G3]|uniref:Nascent polypeptide-associated complex subunit beta n=1 Tax=Trichomonas vaginalis (strain ATCC PRA-98 / G3) TaxID=412133 RepID=A2FB71_TRIV3|nr:NAC domain family [Trichomonas vaginalis G3]EAX97852.1 NAC domain containing protein [Trichomonas vaginalis G3]KAI5541787.1 NAC domain family [Trichomonas vaginalis G3]|eukprot:XP_001310782.1 NAC domain containing protein [Trichomonas vaginalis G3]